MEKKVCGPPNGTNLNESAPINDTYINQILVLGAVKLCRKLPRRRAGSVCFVSAKICIKVCSGGHLSEASTMRFVARNTSIPVPKVYCAFTYNGATYIAMERIKGDMLAKGWVKRSPGSKATLLAQLRVMVEELRRIPSPRESVSNVDGGPIHDVRMPDIHGPYIDVHEFHKQLRGGLGAHPDHYADLSKMIALQDGRQWALKFTHGDLSSLNILARGDNIVGIIDWETAGFYPEYWEYTSACQVHPFALFWRDEIEKFIQPVPEALEMEKIRQKYFGDMTCFT
jgi:tRNA A-37 threonylcarbamoyl transferase component Bud32